MQSAAKSLFFNAKPNAIAYAHTPMRPRLPHARPQSNAHAHAYLMRSTDNPRAHGYPCHVMAKKGQA